MVCNRRDSYVSHAFLACTSVSLLDVFKEIGAAALSTSRGELFANFLNWFWLRPENALLLTLRAEVLQPHLQQLSNSRSLDVSCGDGVFSFISCGGSFESGCDMFQALDLSQDRRGNFDAFDAWSEEYSVSIAERPPVSFTVGTDWKPNLLRKAQELNFYSELLEHDNRQPLPLESESFRFVYSNSAYWVPNMEEHLLDLQRLLQKGGSLVLEMKTTNIEAFSSYAYAEGTFGTAFCDLVDGGRRSTWKGLRSLAEYEDIFRTLPGMKLVDMRPMYGGLPAIMWDVGLRPLFRPLSRLAQSAPGSVRHTAKLEWISTLRVMFDEYLAGYSPDADTAIEWLFVLEKT